MGLGAAISAACRDASSSNPTTPVRDPGAVRVVIAAAGVEVPSQFSVTIDNRTTRAIGRNDSTTFVDLPTGSHTLALGGVGADCTLGDRSPRTVNVGSRDTTRTSFTVTCWGPGVGGSQLAFVRNGDIYSATLNGSSVRQLTTIRSSNEPSWSPDGQRIAFSRSSDIYIMNADGSNVVRRTTIGTNYGPAWSPDGRRLAYTSLRADGADVFVVSADDDGRAPTRLTAGCDPAWSPDGTRIAFGGPSCDDLNRDDLFVMNADGSRPIPVTNGAATRTLYANAAWSPDGRRFAATACTPSWPSCDIVIVNADGSGLTTIASGWQPKWSPNGRIIVFANVSSGTSWLYGVAVDGNYQGPILIDAYSPSWRP